VNDGPTPGVDIDYQVSTTSLSANWTDFGAHAAFVNHYEWQILRKPDDAVVQDFTDVGLAKVATNSSLSLTAGTQYYVKVRATFTDGSTATGQSNGVMVGTVQATTALDPGYNLIALKVIPATTLRAANLAQQITPTGRCQAILMYNASSQIYDFYFPAGSGSGNNFQILPGAGYFLLMSNSATLTSTGYPLSSVTTPITLQSGYNLVSVAKTTSTPYTAESALVEIKSQGGTATDVLSWLTTGQNFNIHSAGKGNDFRLDIGSGYFIRCPQSSIWTLTRP
jgi:hypothetical protein